MKMQSWFLGPRDHQGQGCWLRGLRVIPHLEPARKWHFTDMHGLVTSFDVTVVLLNIYICGFNHLFLSSQVTEPAIRTHCRQGARGA